MNFVFIMSIVFKLELYSKLMKRDREKENMKFFALFKFVIFYLKYSLILITYIHWENQKISRGKQSCGKRVNLYRRDKSTFAPRRDRPKTLCVLIVKKPLFKHQGGLKSSIGGECKKCVFMQHINRVKDL